MADKVICSGQSARIADGFAIGIKRYADTDGKPLWRFHVAKGCGGEPMIDFDATPEVLRKMTNELSRFFEAIVSDGGRDTAGEKP